MNSRTLLIALLAVVIAAGTVIGAGCGSRPLEITTVPPSPLQGDVFIDGEVGNPGIYPWREGDTIADIIRAAGGVTGGGDLSRIQLHIPGPDSGEASQKIDINRAGAWLLEALTGIGPVLAQAIVDYREEHGPFRSTGELLNVNGIGEAILEQIEPFITVDE